MSSSAPGPSTESRPATWGPLFAIRGRVVVDGTLLLGAVVVEGRKIVAVHRGEGPLDLPKTVIEADVVAPGFIDLQINGGFGVEVGESEAALRHLAEHLPTTGVTAFLPTLVSSSAEIYPRVLDACLRAADVQGALPLGLHLEGPFLSTVRAGAHRVEAIEAAPADLFEPFFGRGALRLVTLAPEVSGALERIRRLRSEGVVVSLGHTNASYEEFIAGIDAGASLVTHLYSAMSGFGHRAPGAVGAALVDDRITVGLIADGVHCHPASLRLAVRAKGPERVALVTDAIAGAGMKPGVYQLDGQDIFVDDTFARLPNGTLAGSVLTMDRAVRNTVQWCGVGIADACRMASEVPARLLGLETKGRLAPGADADLVLLDSTGAVQETLREGKTLYRSGSTS